MRFTASLALAVALLFGASSAFAQSADLAPPAPGSAPALGMAKPAPSTPDLGGPSVVLFDQATLVTNPGGGPGGTDLSVLQGDLGMTTLGAGHQQNLGNYIADDFDVPAGQTWNITSMNFYGYQTGSTAAASTFTGYYVQVWDGDPSMPGSTVIAGDLTTNVLTASVFSNIYRVTNTTTTATNRPIYKNTVMLGAPLSLIAGTYWVQWGATGSLSSGPWMVPVTITGQTTTGNALQFITPPGAWQPLLDGGTSTPQGGTFQVVGNTGTVSGPVLTINPASIDFGSIQVGANDTQTVTLTNNGTANVVISSIAYTGSGMVTINQTGTQLVLAPGASTTFTVTFAPTAVGNVSGTITVTSNAPGSPATIAVTGTGTNDTFASFCSGTQIDMPSGQPTTTSGPFSPYPGLITVPANPPMMVISDVDVRLVNMNHTFPADLDIFVEHPTGPTALVMSDAGGGTDLVGVTITLDDEAAAPLPTTAITTGSYQPTNLGTAVDPFDPPAPTPSGNTMLSAFDNLSGAGTWNLWGDDDAGGDVGFMAEWCLDITYSPVVASGDGATATDALTVAPNPATGTAMVRLTVAEAQDVTVTVYDVTGRQVATLHDGAVASGQELSLRVDASSLPAGVYVVRATGTDLALTQRVTVVR